MKNFAFDIESVPLSTDQLQSLLPVFDPDSVKVGNLGPDKAAEKIEKAKQEQFARFYRDAALSALTGEIAMIGIRGQDGSQAILEGDEKEIIARWLAFFDAIPAEGRHWIGFNIAAFDVPFLLRRAWFHGLKIPYGIVRGRYLTGFFTDLLELWNASDRGSHHFAVSLDQLARFFGIGAKTNNGAQFHELLRYKPDQAREYLLNDLELTWAIAERMGAIRGPIPEPGPLRQPETEAESEVPVQEAFQIQFY